MQLTELLVCACTVFGPFLAETGSNHLKLTLIVPLLQSRRHNNSMLPPALVFVCTFNGSINNLEYKATQMSCVHNSTFPKLP